MRRIGLLLCVIGVMVFGLLNAVGAGAQQPASSCAQCHGPNGTQPVDMQAAWHQQHNFTDLCQTCHGGNGQSIDPVVAHQGVVCNPLLRTDAPCAICHPDNAAEMVAQYELSIGTAETSVCAPGGAATVAPPTPTLAVATPTPVQTTGATQQTVTPAVAVALPETPSPSFTPSLTPTALSTAAVSAGQPVTPPLSGWFSVLKFARGPLFRGAFIFFVIGMLFRLVQALRAGWRHRPATGKRASVGNIGLSFLRGLLVLPFIPWIKGTFWRSPVIYIGGGLFHLGLFGVVLFSKTHMSAWKGVVGFGWPVLPNIVVDWLSVIGILAMLALLANRIVNPVLRLISRGAEWLNWAFVFVPMLSGFILARRLWFPYEAMFSIHLLWVDFLLVWIPLSRISHWMFYFFSRAIHGVEFGKRVDQPVQPSAG